MTVLSDGEILQRLAHGDLHINPLEPELQIQPASIDLRLSPYLATMTDNPHHIIDPSNTATIAAAFNPVALPPGASFTLFPGYSVLGATIETVQIPTDMRGQVFGRSSIGRLFIQIHTAGYIDPGFSGTITLEISNLGRNPVVLLPGMRICQLSLEELGQPALHPYGTKPNSKYQGQDVPTLSRIHRDFEGK